MTNTTCKLGKKSNTFFQSLIKKVIAVTLDFRKLSHQKHIDRLSLKKGFIKRSRLLFVRLCGTFHSHAAACHLRRRRRQLQTQKPTCNTLALSRSLAHKRGSGRVPVRPRSLVVPFQTSQRGESEPTRKSL